MMNFYIKIVNMQNNRRAKRTSYPMCVCVKKLFSKTMIFLRFAGRSILQATFFAFFWSKNPLVAHHSRVKTEQKIIREKSKKSKGMTQKDINKNIFKYERFCRTEFE